MSRQQRSKGHLSRLLPDLSKSKFTIITATSNVYVITFMQIQNPHKH